MKKFKNIIKITFLFASILFLSACQKEDQTFGDIVAPSNITLDFDIVGQDSANQFGDGSGLVNFTASADNAIAYRFNFGDNTGDIVAPGGINQHRFTQSGLNTYNVVVIATGRGGVSTSFTTTLDVFSNFNPIEIKNMLTGGASSSKTWYWNAPVTAHLGVGPLETPTPDYYAAAPFEKEDVGCLYEDALTFYQDANQEVTYELVNQGNTYFNRGEVQGELGLPNPTDDSCYEYDTSGVKIVNFSPSSSGLDETVSTQTNFTILDGFMSYFLDANEYEILSISDTEIHVRTIQVEDSGGMLAWYQKFTTDPGTGGGGICAGDTGETGSGNNDVLVWAEEFDTDGAPCVDNWSYDLGTGDGGWGNGEQQYYTDRPENISIIDGILNITLSAEEFSGSDYTSARIKSENKFEFTYGKVAIRAKMPTGGGTWPALWMLGANYDVVDWPACGEIDIAEHIGNEQNTIFSTLHFPGNSGGNGITNTVVIPDASTEFHIYETQWTEDSINFFVDGVQFHSFDNNSNVPFNHDFFLILNVAMGGNFGGQIDPNFISTTMEVDYVRVYQ